MPDIIAHSGRDLDYVSADVKIKYRDTDGIVRTYTKALLDADGAKETAILTKIGIVGTTRIENVKDNYALNGTPAVLDEDDNVFTTTWQTGKKIKYTTLARQSALFLDAGATA